MSQEWEKCQLKLNRRQCGQFTCICESKIIIYNVCSQCWQNDYKIIKLSYHPCVSLHWYSNSWYTISFGGALPFFFLGLSWLRLPVNRGLALALINPQSTLIIFSVCQGPFLMGLCNLHLLSAVVTLPWYHWSEPCASNLTQIRRFFQCHGITRSASRSRGPDNQWN